MREAEDTIETANDLRTNFGLGALSLENAVYGGGPFTGEIDFPSFGAIPAQERLRSGLSNVPALTWQYLIITHINVGNATNPLWYEIEGATKLDLATAKSFHDRGVLFIDVGTDAEGQWKKGRVPGAINLPFVGKDPVKKRIRETTFGEIVDKTEEVVFYWCPPKNSVCIPAWATAKAVNWGYQNVYYFKGGALAWEAAGYPIEKGE